jgi:DNA-binding helix-hairpin-helix protein with protein kinase domain
MNRAEVTRVFDETGAPWNLGVQIAAGGEGSVFLLRDRPDRCIKLYHQRPIPPERVAKLRALRAIAPAVTGSAAVPLGFVSETAGATAWSGVLLPHVEGHDVYELYNPQGRQAHFRQATFEFVVAAALNLARAFEALHAQEVVVGDISEQNIRVRPDATVTLIDCDGFQISDGSRVFTSNVGTPIWTPPELQSRDLRGVLRTRNHDLFGLAQLVFLLLMGGRYPFAGCPVSGDALSPEEAVAMFAFAFDPAPAPALLKPPPGAPRLDAMPPRFTELFLRAFRRGSEAPESRPTAAEWSDALEKLRSEMGRCSRWEAHVHWRHASQCPWCVVLERSGVDLFPGPALSPKKGSVHERPPGLQEMARRLARLQLEPIPLAAPTKISLQQGVLDSGVLELDWWGALSKRMGPLGRILSGNRQRALLKELETLRHEILGFTQKAASLYLGYAAALRELQTRALHLAEALRTAASWEHRALERYIFQHRTLALRRYLESFLLRRYEIQALSQGRKAALLSQNIVTAADVTPEAVRAVPGFPEPLVERLVRWRRECERGFRYTEPRWIPEGVRAEAAGDALRGASILLQQGLACEALWIRSRDAYARDQAVLQSQYREAIQRGALVGAELEGLK